MQKSEKQRLPQPVPVDLSASLVENRVSLEQLAGPQITVSTRICSGGGRVDVERARIDQILGQIAVHARNALPSGGHLTLETLALDLDRDAAFWHPQVSTGQWVLLVATEAASPEWRLRHLHAPKSVLSEPPDRTLATIQALVVQAGGLFAATPTPGGGRRMKLYFPHLAPPAPRKLNPAR